MWQSNRALVNLEIADQWLQDLLEVCAFLQQSIFRWILICSIYLFLLLCCCHAGYKPFVEACIEEEENAEALKYIVKLTDPQERAEVCSIYCY